MRTENWEIRGFFMKENAFSVFPSVPGRLQARSEGLPGQKHRAGLNMEKKAVYYLRLKKCPETNRRDGGGHKRRIRHARGNSQNENGAENHKRQRIEDPAVGVVSYDAPVRPVVVQCDLLPYLW